ncbi:hypothetical protein AJ88_03145 [Mesorhizobium amorphae CCBAU 01583]|nr:hypothetical protein AJ88_03145 [Mesorhizobium amorphae CCBAU 01583]
MTLQAVALARADRKKPSKPEIPWRQRPFLPLETAAELLGLSRSSLYRLESEGKVIFNRLGGRTLVAVPSVVKLIDAAEQWTPPTAAQQRAQNGRSELVRGGKVDGRVSLAPRASSHWSRPA